jgi:hypothetical protein
LGALGLFIAFFGASPARAELAPVTYRCLADSARRFDVPLAMLLVVMDTESGKVGMASANSNGTRDLGPMQVNTFWLPRLKELGVTEEILRDNGCVNVAVAAWILKGALAEGGGRLDALMSYHSRKPGRRQIYLKAAMDRAPGIEVDRTLAKANARVAELAGGLGGAGSAGAGSAGAGGGLGASDGKARAAQAPAPEAAGAGRAAGSKPAARHPSGGGLAKVILPAAGPGRDKTGKPFAALAPAPGESAFAATGALPGGSYPHGAVRPGGWGVPQGRALTGAGGRVAGMSVVSGKPGRAGGAAEKGRGVTPAAEKGRGVTPAAEKGRGVTPAKAPASVAAVTGGRNASFGKAGKAAGGKGDTAAAGKADTAAGGKGGSPAPGKR